MKVEEFIQANAHRSSAELSLILSKQTYLPRDYIINQINGLSKAKSKFPFLLDFPDFVFPNSRAIEQASSEQTAKFKASLFKGNHVADLSGGMGLDSFFFSKSFQKSTYLELNPELYQNSKENFEVLKATNISSLNQKAEDFITQTQDTFDLIYVDPDRRVTKSKAFRIDECEPKLNEILPLIWQKTNNCLVKLSPMLDIKQALEELKNCKTVYVVSVKNDCKELLFHLEKDFIGTTEIKARNLNGASSQDFDFNFDSEKTAEINFQEPQNFLLDPNVAILKAGGFKSICTQFRLNKIAINTHLYTSDLLVENFPGRQFKIEEEIKLKKGKLNQANVISKNYPLKADQIKSKFKIQDGGNEFIIALSDFKNQKRAFHCTLV